MTVRWAYIVTVLWTGSDKIGQVWTSPKRCAALFFLNRESHAVQIFAHPKPSCSFLTGPCSKRYDPQGGGNSLLSRFNWHKVWTGVKCNFYSPHHQKQYIVGKLSISRVRMCNFTRTGRKTKKLWLSITPARKPSEQPGLGPPRKGVNCNFSSPEFDKPYGVRKLKYGVSTGLPKR